MLCVIAAVKLGSGSSCSFPTNVVQLLNLFQNRIYVANFSCILTEIHQSFLSTEKGFCVRGDLCPFDHGNDPLIVDDVNLPKMIPFPPPPVMPPASLPMPPITEPPPPLRIPSIPPYSQPPPPGIFPMPSELFFVCKQSTPHYS